MTFEPATSKAEYVIVPLQLESRGSEPVMAMAGLTGALQQSSDPACPQWQGRELQQQGREQQQLEARSRAGVRTHRAFSLGCLFKGA